MGLTQIVEVAERVGARDEDRRQAFREEFERFEAGEVDSFLRTREALSAEREALATLDAELDAEAENIEELIEYADFLTVEQAVEHRDETVEKLEAHNRYLREFHDAMVDALDVVETNLDRLAADGMESVEGDPEPHFERAYDALEAHNEAVEGLDTNITILNAYLV